MNWFESFSTLEYNYVPKQEGIRNIKNFYQKMKTDNIDYYINTKSLSIADYLDNTIIEPKDFELKNMLNQYLIMCKEKLSGFDNEFIKYPNNILVCMTKDKVYWDDVFTLKNIIYINYSKLVEIFYKKETDYNSVSEVYITENGIYDMELVKQLFKSIIYTSMYNNLDTWIKKITLQLNCDILYKNNITWESDSQINLFQNPNTDFISEFFIITYSNDNKTLVTLDTIEPTLTKYQPYITSILFEIEFKDGKLILTKANAPINFSGNPFVDFVEKIVNIFFV